MWFRSQLIYSVFYIFKEFNNIYMSAPYQQFVFWTINLIIRFSIMNVFEILLNNITNRTGLDTAVSSWHICTILYIYYKFLVSWNIKKTLPGFWNLFDKFVMQGFLKYGRNWNYKMAFWSSNWLHSTRFHSKAFGCFEQFKVASTSNI